MTNTIVVPLDGSELSQAALPIANELAAALDSSILLLASGWGTTVEELIGYLDNQGVSLTVPFKSSVVPDTFPATAIANAVNDPDDAIVMGTHGRTGFGKALLGSVSEDVLKRSNNPVLLVGPQAKPFRSFKGATMVVTTDGSSDERASIEAWFQKTDRDPLTNEIVRSKVLVANKTLKTAIQAARDLQRALQGEVL